MDVYICQSFASILIPVMGVAWVQAIVKIDVDLTSMSYSSGQMRMTSTTKLCLKYMLYSSANIYMHSRKIAYEHEHGCAVLSLLVCL